jgi:hypothetical protein
LRTGSVFDTLTYTSPISSLQFDAAKIISAGTSSAIDVSLFFLLNHVVSLLMPLLDI